MYTTESHRDYMNKPNKNRATNLLMLLRLRKQRRDLQNLTDQQLTDIGLSRSEAEQEAKRSVWNAPSHWKG